MTVDSGLSGLLGAFIGAGAVILAGIMTNRHEKKLQRQQLFRDRLEELYMLIGQIDGYVFAEVLHAGMLAEGIMSDEEYLERYPTAEVETQVDNTRIEMIVGIYGKKFKQAYEAVNNSRNFIIALKGELERLYLQELPTEEKYGALTEAYNEFQAAIKALKSEIATSVLA